MDVIHGMILAFCYYFELSINVSSVVLHVVCFIRKFAMCVSFLYIFSPTLFHLSDYVMSSLLNLIPRQFSLPIERYTIAYIILFLDDTRNT